MKEILLFTLSSQVADAVEELGKLGAVDVRHINPPSGERIDRVADKVQQTESAIAILENYAKAKGNRSRKNNSTNPAMLVDRILVSGDVKKQCQVRLQELQHQQNWYDTWGKDVDIHDIQYLHKKGIYVRLYLIDKSRINSLPNDQHIVTFAEQESKVPVALFARSPSDKLNFKEEKLPDFSHKGIEIRTVRKKRQIEEVDNYLVSQIENLTTLYDYKNYLLDRLNTRKTLEGMGAIEGKVKYLRGYLPNDSVQEIKSKAEEKNWGYEIREPENPDEVPVLIKNPKWVSIINPVLKFIDIVPGYKEVDVSIYFLVAFSLFFAMLVGDAGYGALFLLIAFIFRKKIPSPMRYLAYVLSTSTIIWGVMSGTYFGSEQIASIPFLNQLIVPEIASFGVDNISFMMHLSFLIGVIHLTIAHGIRIVQYINSIKAVSEIGWIAFVWGLFFVAEKLVLGVDMPGWSNWLFIVGFVLVAFFSTEGKTFIGSILNSVANLPLKLINGFSDIVSYVRLFAVGMATATVAASFNSMILPEGGDISFFGLIIAAIALILGHGLNIVLALMAVMVHGIRLNMLEFAGHLGVQFSGEAYQPFKLNNSHKENGLEEKLRN